ncbi:MAG: cytochrome c biogenesis protein CcsA [Thermoguttaceae bacterium]|nr:cytochrome c biogenesis protein CcsA [Thermoguttaceae bacterium]
MGASTGKFRLFLFKTFDALGSITLGIVIMTILAIAMGWATFLEREMGTPVAQYVVYASKWFYVLIGLLALNVLCAALVRAPWLFVRALRDPNEPYLPNAKKFRVNQRLLPFFIAHVGVLLLLAGCLTTARLSSKARATIAETTAVETAIDVDSRLFDVKIYDQGTNDHPRKKIEVPFAGGPLNWRDYESAANWKADVADPLLAQKPEGKFFQDLAKSASKISQRAAFLFAKLARTTRPGVIYDDAGLKIEVLDYATMADFQPVAPLKGELTVGGKKTPFELPFSFDMTGSDPIGQSRRAQRVTLADGTRVVYMIADSQQDFQAFQNAIPQRVEGSADEPQDALVVLSVDGVVYQKKLADLALLSRYVDLDSQTETLTIQRDEISRRLKQEEERSDVAPDERDGAKPLATVTREEILRQTNELRELSDKLTQSADAATDPLSSPERLEEFAQARKEFESKRILNYLSNTWAQLEGVTETSKEFRETLVRMREQNDKALDEVKLLEEATKLGDSGWKIVGFETSPTTAPGVEELQGWSAVVRLKSPEGEENEASLFSELYERNKFPESGRVFGGIWLDDVGGDDNEFGRPWSKNLDKPKLEFMQDLAGDVAYRVVNGAKNVVSGVLELAALDETAGTFQASPVQVENARGEGAVTAFSVSQLALHDEIGAKLVPGVFQKDQANEFYGKARVRVTLDDVTETFLMRSIPLESVTKEQIAFLEKRIVSGKRHAVVRLTDREIDLGAALFVKKFTATYEPGSSTAASFSSLTRVLPKGQSRDEQRLSVLSNTDRDVLIQMNRPGVLRPDGSKKVYWAYQDSFRGPYRPGDPEFDDVVKAKLIPGESVPRETLYQTIITLNDDPGRGMKYLGSLLVVWGTAMLVYRRKKSSAKTRDAEKAQNTTSSPADAPDRAGKASVAVLSALVAVASLLGSFALADEIVPPEEKAEVKAKTASSVQLNWTPWRLVTVYDGGRRQPLNTFAEIVVRDVTGSPAPTFVLPEETLAKLEGDAPVNMPSLDEFLGDDENESDDAEARRAEKKRMYDEVSAEVVKRQRDAAARLRVIFKNGSRQFNAAELLFSWIVEPELWEYVPFIADPQSVVAKDVLKKSPEEIAKRGSRLAPTDFDELDANGKSRVDAFIEQSRGLAAKSASLKALEKFEDKVATFRSLTFVPTQSTSTRPAFYFNKILYGDSPMGMPGAAHMASQSALSKLDASCARIERLLSSEKAAERRASPFYDKEFVLRQRTPIGEEKNSGDALMLARQLAMLASLSRRYQPATSGVLFEKLVASLEKTLADLKTHRDEIIREQTYSLEYRQEIQRVVSSLESIVDNLELAYLSTTAEPPKTLAVVPVVRASLFRATENQDSPWVPLQTLLWASDCAYARFIDPRAADTLPELDEDSFKQNDGAEKISPADDVVDSLRKTLNASQCDRAAGRAFLNAAEAYRNREEPDRAALFNAAIVDFAASLREIGLASEEKRAELAAAEIADEKARAEFLAKTCYDVPRGLKAELFYYKLNAFYWNWVCCLLALGAFVLSYLRQIVARFMKKAPLAERFFFTLGIVFLALSCAVAFLGGATRAYITGWAPVANMFETVVLLAFLIAAIAIGYALAPAWTKPYLNAWRVVAWPWKVKDRSEKKIARIMAIPRALLVALCFAAAFLVWRSGHVGEPIASGLLRTFREAFAMKGALDSFAVLITFLFVAWAVPRFVAALLALACFSKTLCQRPDLSPEEAPKTRKEVLAMIGNEIVQRKAFLTASSVIALAVAASAYFNSVEFNPNIRPLVAVLRSNFWLTIHVIAIIVSYALGALGWVVALTSLASYIFGQYGVDVPTERTPSPAELRSGKRPERRRAVPKVNKEPAPKKDEKEPSDASQKPSQFEPDYAVGVAPVVAMMIRSAVLFLTAGIILGARWADFSWGRFWSWDPKEVWALVTLLIYLVVLHAHKISGGKRFVLALGANFGALAIIMTWYGLSFVMGGGGRHAYASGESNKIAALYILFAVNILWAVLAILRYWFEVAKSRRNNSRSRAKTK